MVLDTIEMLALLASQAIIKKLGEETASSALGFLRRRRSAAEADEQQRNAIEGALKSHLIEVSSWASLVQIAGMTQPVATADSTLPLSLTDIPRRFSFPGVGLDQGRLLDEADLLSTQQNFVLLGDPGAGKTTTIKRLIGRILTEPPAVVTDTWSVPVLVVLRDDKQASSAAWLVLQKLGQIEAPRLDLSGIGTATPQNVALAVAPHDEALLVRQAAAVLNAIRAVLFLDGLDEVDPGEREKLETSISVLARHLDEAKIIVSCRSGDYSGQLEGFSTVEMCSLSAAQISEASDRRLAERSSAFLRDIGTGPPADLASRPLFLCQMMTIYERSGAIPSRPSTLCHQMTRLMLQDWDQQRHVKRTSRYGRDFGPDEKFDFLTHLAYILTLYFRGQRFSHEHLLLIYEKIHFYFDLPEREADKVASEIETHTGIIAAVGFETFEFTHLSLQEHLAAEFAVKSEEKPFPLFAQSPATSAVAIGLSTSPSSSLASLLLDVEASTHSKTTNDLALRSFTSRLVQERPRFSPSTLLGSAVLRLLAMWPYSDDAPIVRLLKLPHVTSSVIDAIEAFYVARDARGATVLTRLSVDGLPEVAPARCTIEGMAASLLFSGEPQPSDASTRWRR